MNEKIFKKGAAPILLILVILFVIIDILVIGGGSALQGSVAGSYSREGTPTESGIINYDDYGNVLPSGFGCANVPLYRQNQEPWASISYGCGGTTLSSSGCGIVSAAMVLTYWGIDTDPAALANLSLNNGYRTCGSGTAHGFFSWIASYYGLQAKNNIGWDEILENLNLAKPVIVSGQGSEPFTSSGHFIVLTCYNEDGTISVNDPARGTSIYDPGVIKNQMHFNSVIYKE